MKTPLIAFCLLFALSTVAQKYPHTGTRVYSTVENPNTYTAHVDGVGDETCTFYDHDVDCSDDSQLFHDDNVSLRLSNDVRETSGLCGDDTAQKMLNGPNSLALDSPFPYRIEKDKLYIPYHVEKGTDSGKKYLFISRDNARVDGEVCIELAPQPVPPASVLPVPPVLPPPPPPPAAK